MFLDHHAVPFASGDVVVVVIAKFLVALECTFHHVGPFVGFGVVLGIKFVVHGLCVVHFIEVGHGLHGEEDELLVGVVVFGSQGDVLAQGFRFQFDELVRHLFPFSRFQVIGFAVEHFRRDAPGIFAVEVQDACGFFGLVFAKGCGAELFRMLQKVGRRVLLGIPCHVEEERDGVFHGLEVAHVQHPQLVHAIVIGEL